MSTRNKNYIVTYIIHGIMLLLLLVVYIQPYSNVSLCGVFFANLKQVHFKLITITIQHSNFWFKYLIL